MIQRPQKNQSNYLKNEAIQIIIFTTLQKFFQLSPKILRIPMLSDPMVTSSSTLCAPKLNFPTTFLVLKLINKQLLSGSQPPHQTPLGKNPEESLQIT